MLDFGDQNNFTVEYTCISDQFFFSVSFGVAFVIRSPFVVVYENAIFMIKLFLSKAKLPP